MVLQCRRIHVQGRGQRLPRFRGQVCRAWQEAPKETTVLDGKTIHFGCSDGFAWDPCIHVRPPYATSACSSMMVHFVIARKDQIQLDLGKVLSM